jgi:CHASE3 domain sensor protein
MSSNGTNTTVIKMFALVAFFILLFGSAAIYAAIQSKNLKKELQETKQALEACEKKH